jgi:hypothetical protein
MELSFELIQKRIKKERKENLNVLGSVEKRLENELLKFKTEKKTQEIHIIDFIKILCIKEKFKSLPKDEIINLIDCVSDYIIAVRGILTASVQLTIELDKTQDVQEKVFIEKGEKVKVIKEPEELKKHETDIMDDVRNLYKEINIILAPLMEGKDCSSSLYFEDAINELIKMKHLSLLNNENLNRLLYLNIELAKKWLILMITTINRAFVLENLINANKVEISEFMELNELLKKADARRFYEFMDKLMR